MSNIDRIFNIIEDEYGVERGYLRTDIAFNRNSGYRAIVQATIYALDRYYSIPPSISLRQLNLSYQRACTEDRVWRGYQHIPPHNYNQLQRQQWLRVQELVVCERASQARQRIDTTRAAVDAIRAVRRCYESEHCMGVAL